MNRRTSEWSKSVLLSLTLVILTAGCKPAFETTSSRQITSIQQASGTHLDRVVSLLTRVDEFERDEALRQSAYHLNRWIGTQEIDSQWEVDERVETLPGSIRRSQLVLGSGSLQFSVEDAESLMESIWMRDLSTWVSSRQIAGPMGESMREFAAEVGRVEGQDLVLAHRLFDWTVRNIQLDESLPFPADALAVPGESSGGAQRSRPPPPMRGVRGPGYQYYPWQVLLQGHGDSISRARIFTLLARQQGIDVVTLAFPGKTIPPRPQFWLTAVLLKGQLYLFDSRLGVPIPGRDGAPLATLQQLKEDPQLLKSLNVGSEFQYPVKHRDLSSVMALIDASPQALSRRMELLEHELSGDRRVRLSCSPSRIAQEVEAIAGISKAAIWTVPFHTNWFQSAYLNQVENDPQVAARYMREFGMFNVRSGLLRGRYRHIRGQFDREGDADGAKLLYLKSRMSNSQISEIETSEKVQEILGVERRDGEQEIIWRRRISAAVMMMSETKRHASYWLGLAHFDTQDYRSSIEWLQDRTLEATPDGPWTEGARYNLGRTLEAQGELKKARERYLIGQSPQQHGNLLRARFLRKTLEAADLAK